MPLVAEQLSHLLEAARRHDAHAWNTLLKQSQLPLYTYVAELLRDREAAFDVVQETFITAVRQIGSLRDDTRFVSWLFSIAHQRCLQHFRRNRRAGDFFAEAGQTPDQFIDPDLDDPSTQLVRSENTAEFLALLEQLPPVQRSALLLHVLEGFPLEDIAAITAVPVGTVKSRLHHAKRALRKLVENQT
jgi:RNA polymerase sigma-70 factor (ECF subfamily)